MKIGIFGGTFDPIHNGHVLAARAFRESAALDLLYVMPDKIPPHKQIAAHDDPHLRFEMARLAFAGDERTTVSDMELRREGKSYTYQTLCALRDEGMTDLYLYCGTDMLLTLDSWYRAADILAMCTVAYAGREHQDAALRARVAAQRTFLCENFGARILDIPLDPVEISSSEIRAMIAAGQDAGAYLPPPVYEFIKEKKLYQ